MKRFLSIAPFLLFISFTIVVKQKSLSAASAPTVLLRQSDARLLAIETQLAQLVNEERDSRHLPLLTYDSRLADVARAHSAEMRDEKYFSHESPTPQLQWPLNRYQDGMQQTPRLVAENIYRHWSSQRGLPAGSAEQAHQGLMNSPGHKANILLPSVTYLGIGVQANSNGDIWVTEMFAKPR
ncbi:MAG: CAP domain-containing protein [Abditibacteriaceae bacterium]